VFSQFGGGGACCEADQFVRKMGGFKHSSAGRLHVCWHLRRAASLVGQWAWRLLYSPALHESGGPALRSWRGVARRCRIEWIRRVVWAARRALRGGNESVSLAYDDVDDRLRW